MSKTRPKDILNNLICEGFVEEIWGDSRFEDSFNNKEVLYNPLSMRRQHEEASLPIEGTPKSFHIKSINKGYSKVSTSHCVLSKVSICILVISQ